MTQTILDISLSLDGFDGAQPGYSAAIAKETCRSFGTMSPGAKQ